jgi:hypothetical protein
MVQTWETPTVDFKRELVLGTPAANAEFARDVTALANTIAPGSPRHLVVGYDPDSHEFTHPLPSRVYQDRLEQLLNRWSDPQPGIRLMRVQHESGIGEVGIIEVVRDPSRLPYRIAKAGGKLHVGDVFVRHGSHVEPPTAGDLAWLAAEASRAMALES